MTTVQITTPGGTTDGSVELPDSIFDVTANVPLMHQVVVAQLAAARQGTHKTKTRGEVSGGGRKPYRQKGTGRARQGSTRAPQFNGGGVVHGPVPRSYTQRTPKKMKAAALRGALSDRARSGNVHVLSSLVDGTTPSTKTARAALKAVSSAKNILVVLADGDDLRLEEPAQRPRGAPADRRSAEHLRRAGQRRRGVHPRRARRVPGRQERRRRVAGSEATSEGMPWPPSCDGHAVEAAATAGRHAVADDDVDEAVTDEAVTDETADDDEGEAAK